MTSFFSERTAEYSILPIIVSYLQHQFGAAVPMYYWASREGNTVARDIHCGQRVRMLAFFARRPKSVTEQAMLGKLNAELFQFAGRAASHGIPTIAGFPVVRDIFELGGNFRTFWFPLVPSQPQDVFFKIDLTRPIPSLMSESGHPIQTLELNELDHLVSSAKVFSWEAAMRAIRDTRIAPRMMGRIFWGGGNYNPVYLLIPE